MTDTEWIVDHAGDECCDIVTTGRRTGAPHRVEIWFGVESGTLYPISGNGPTADWYRNMLAHPEVVVEVAGRACAGVARDVVDPSERRRCGELMGAKYVWGGDPSIGLTYEAWCFDVPAIAIEFDRVDPRP